VRTGDENAFHPRLVFTTDSENGTPISARLSPKTREFLESLSLSQRTSQHQTVDTQDQSSGDGKIACCNVSIAESSAEGKSLSSGDSISSADDSAHLVEIPLTTDSEFFHLLKSEVSSLDALQAQEEVLATEEVASLGKEIAKVAAPAKNSAKTDIYRWREIISLYSQANVFYSTHESDHGTRSSAVAKKQFQWFLAELEKRNLLKQFKRHDSPAVLNHFIQLNMELLRNLRFQEINRLAMTKILKSQYTKHISPFG
jgi:E3 ubiquitin-protein ligase BAH